MKFSDILKQAITLLQDSGRMSYRVLKREFALNEEQLEDLKLELIEGSRLFCCRGAAGTGSVVLEGACG